MQGFSGKPDTNVDSEVGNTSHEISYAKDAAVDAGRAFDLEHGGDCNAIELDYVDILDQIVTVLL